MYRTSNNPVSHYFLDSKGEYKSPLGFIKNCVKGANQYNSPLPEILLTSQILGRGRVRGTDNCKAKYNLFPYFILLICLGITFLGTSCQPSSNFKVKESDTEILIQTTNYDFQIEKEGFKYQFIGKDGGVIAPPHAESGIQIGMDSSELSNIIRSKLVKSEKGFVEFEVKTAKGLAAVIKIWIAEHTTKLQISPIEEGNYTIVARTGGIAPAYGMGDHAARGKGGHNLVLENFVRAPLKDDHGSQRMISNFVIFPQQGFAEVNMNPEVKIIRITDSENAQGSMGVQEIPAFYYFIGDTKEIYQTFLDARNAEGYKVYKPKHQWFGVGWEAFGALAWQTNHETVTENINTYLDYNYPLSWMVVGSGFWPRGAGEFDEHGTPYNAESATEAAKKLQATTSFGMWDEELYPTPKEMIDYFHSRGLIFTIGLRVGFIDGGPFTDEGLKKGYFTRDSQGNPRLFKIGFPRSPIYILDHRNPEAVNWYVELCQKWLDYGVDGFKEDLFHWPDDLSDDLIDPVNRKLMDKGVFIMGRNNYLGSPADIHRFDDFNYNQIQDRGPINGLAYAFSGFPYVYPDIIGGTGLATGRFGKEPQKKLKTYIVRYAQYASLNPSMAFGFGPWNFGEEINQLCLNAAQLHQRLKPHIFSNAIKSYHTGFPYSMTPLPLAYPNDPHVYGLADTTQRAFEWMIGESLLAAPLYGDNYPTAFSRDIYLPKGKWMDYESGKEFEGPIMLEDFDVPLEKTPLFVGGNGFVVEQEDGKLFGRIYPLSNQANIDFWAEDGETKSNISISVQNWDQLTVTNKTTKEQVKVALTRHAYQFELILGVNYSIE